MTFKSLNGLDCQPLFLKKDSKNAFAQWLHLSLKPHLHIKDNGRPKDL